MNEKVTATRQTSTSFGFDHLAASVDSLEHGGVLAKEFARLPSSPLFPCTVGKDERVAKKNRDKDVIPYDHNRVILCQSDVTVMDDETDYINASFIRGFRNDDGFIATQGPMLGTVDDFWSMVWAENSRLVVMMCRQVEKCQNQSYKYWPELGDYLDVDDIIIRTEEEDERGTHAIRKFLLRHSKTGEQREIVHLQFLAWPDNFLPCLPTLISFWKTFRRFRTSSAGPPIIHCSDGSQRTGLLIALENTINQWEATSSVDLFSCILRMREDRVGFVALESEYAYLYRACVEAYLCRKSLREAAVFGRKDNGRYNNGLVLGTTSEEIFKEYKVLDKKRPSVENTNTSLECNKNGNILPSDTATQNARVQLQFPCDIGSVFVTCVPLNHQTVRRHCEQRPTRLRHAVSLQENEMLLGISGVLPSEYKSSFLVTPIPTSTQTLDFWQMVFDTGCRTVVRLVESDQALWTQPEKWPVHTPDFSISVMSQTMLRQPINEITLSLNSDMEPVIPFETDIPSEVAITMYTLAWSPDSHVTPSCDTLFQLFKLINKWLHQTSTTLVAVQCKDGWSASGRFCAAYNAVSGLKMDDCVDIYLTARAVQDRLPKAVSQSEYQHLYDLCESHLQHRRQQLAHLRDAESKLCVSDKPSLCTTSSSSSTDD